MEQGVDGSWSLGGRNLARFQQPAGAILANAEIAASSETDGSFPSEEIQNINAIAMRASGIVRQLMIYAGKQKSHVEPIDLSELVDEMVGLMKISISRSAVVRTVLEKDLPAVLGNRPEIQQVVMNLALNASDALGGREGTITVTTAVGRPNGKAVSGSRIDFDGEEFVRLDVSDSGPGISEEARTRIFDPFFTTKTGGRGLGLAVVQGVVRAHKGVIELISELGKGTTFRIFWPIAGKAPDRSSFISPPIGPVPKTGIQGTVLVVEDEDALRSALEKMLRKEGLAVIAVGDGTAAVEILAHDPGKIDLIPLDMTIHGKPSNTVIREAGKLRPNARLILTSAYGPEVAGPSADAPKSRGLFANLFVSAIWWLWLGRHYLRMPD
jgi:CheY-like chemotaxis protein